MQVGFLGGSHARVSESSRYAGDGDASEQQKRRVSMPQPVDRYDGRPNVFAMARQDAVSRRVVDLPLRKYGLSRRKVFEQSRKLHDELPVELNLSHR